MKQLIAKSYCQQHVAVGLGSMALVMINGGGCQCQDGSRKQQLLVELKTSCSVGEDTFSNSVLSVAVSEINIQGVSQLHCVVSREDKSLEMYFADLNKLCDANGIQQQSPLISLTPVRIFQTSKRISCITYARITPDDSIMKNSLVSWCMVCADHAGDAIAYALPRLDIEKLGKMSRVLLGHTASILTKVKIVKCSSNEMYLLSSDRDEKIRVSSFPRTYVVEGYLLGHTEFISCMDVIDCPNTDGDFICVTGSGDGTVRLWDYKKCKEMDKLEPVKESDDRVVAISDVTLNKEGLVAVIRNGSTTLELYEVDHNGFKLKLKQKIDCDINLLSCIFLNENTLCVLAKDPEYVIILKRQEKKFVQVRTHHLQPLNEAASKASIEMPGSLSDVRDSYRNPFEKFKEDVSERTRPAGTSASERKQLAKEASARRKRRKAKQ